MPWKIQSDTKLSGQGANLHMADLDVELHLVTDLKTGVLDLYIGSDIPEEATIHIEVDGEEVKAVSLQAVRSPTNQQARIIESVLRTMNVHPTVLRAFKHELHVRKVG